MAAFCTHISDDEDLYDKFVVDGRTFYRRRQGGGAAIATRDKTPPKRQKRYSDQFKDPVFEQKDTLRKLHMIMAFREKNGDLDAITDMWRECICECIHVLCDEYGFSSTDIFKTFGLGKYGFDCEDFGIDRDEFIEHECDLVGAETASRSCRLLVLTLHSIRATWMLSRICFAGISTYEPF
ncbi:UNVERIFIED_CONTAM: hypothetical protein PYX00_011014 [Menopon gallinae]|uniref:Defective in cullin neddylation protein n=1 Tax=Menopon gallinae TaxID=328185 RepID=A0AAW2H6Q9_9NEOP